jgi:hypothetical protein
MRKNFTYSLGENSTGIKEYRASRRNLCCARYEECPDVSADAQLLVGATLLQDKVFITLFDRADYVQLKYR